MHSINIAVRHAYLPITYRKLFKGVGSVRKPEARRDLYRLYAAHIIAAWIELWWHVLHAPLMQSHCKSTDSMCSRSI